MLAARRLIEPCTRTTAITQNASGTIVTARDATGILRIRNRTDGNATAAGSATLDQAANQIAVLNARTTGALAVYFGAVANAHMQALSLQAFRGRVMAIYSLLGLGTTVVGGPLTGFISQQWSPRAAVALAGVTTITAATALTLARVSSNRLVTVDIPEVDPAI